MASDQDTVERVVEELEQRGAEQPSVEGDISLAAFAGGSEQRDPSATVEYLGDPETVRHACRELDGVQVLDVSTQPWPGGETEVKAEIVVRDAGSGGSNPGGNVDTSGGNAAVPPPAENSATQDPHVPPGGTWAIQDEAGFTDEYEVEVWPVRMWVPRTKVPAVTMLRYIPHPAAEGMEWWAGYVRLAPEDGLGSVDWQALRNQVDATAYRSDHPPLTYHDGDGWVGWVEGDVDGHVDHHRAGDVTEALAQAALEARREVLR